MKPYYGFAMLNIFFNILTVLFSLISLTMVIPFLGILFGETEKFAKPDSFGLSSLKESLYYEMNVLISSYDEKINALLFII